jgi:hypothetical protein
MTFQDCLDIHHWLIAVIRQQLTRADIDDCLDLLGALNRTEKRDLWRWLAEHDPNLKQWLKLQGDRRAAA